MQRYLLEFIGRRNGAIGIVYRCSITVEAEDAEQARLRLYDTHEPHGPVHVAELPPTTEAQS